MLVHQRAGKVVGLQVVPTAISRRRSQKPPKPLNDRIALLETLQRAQQARSDFGRKEPVLSSALGSLWAELSTPWAAAQRLVAWVRCARSELGGYRLLTLPAKTRDLGVFSEFSESLDLSANVLCSALG